jgi:hypothetical protein
MGLQDQLDARIKPFEFGEHFLLLGIDIFDSLASVILRSLIGSHARTFICVSMLL